MANIKFKPKKNFIPTYPRLLTKIDGQVLNLLNHVFQHWSSDQFNMVFNIHLNQPIQDFLLCSNVSVKQVWCSIFVENWKKYYIQIYVITLSKLFCKSLGRFLGR